MNEVAAQLMELAINVARQGMAKGQSPFGCAIRLASGEIIAEHNTVVSSHDPTAHAEINALRTSGTRAGSHRLTGAVVATTCEPCPMCMAALHWARVAEVHYGASIGDATLAGFNEMQLPAQAVVAAGGDKVKLRSGLLAEACQQLFQDWTELPSRTLY